MNNIIKKVDDGVVISLFILVDKDINIEICWFKEGVDGIWFYLFYVFMVIGKGFKCIVKFLVNILCYLIKIVKVLWLKGKVCSLIFFLVM